MVVYIDVFFAINFFMDFAILLTVRKISNQGTGKVRCFFAAVLGAVYSCVLLMLDIGGGIIESVITYIVMSVLMGIISYGYKGIQKLIETITLVFVVTFLLSGIINQLYYRGVINGIPGIIAVATIGCLAIVMVSGYASRKKIKDNVLVITKIVNGDNQVEIKALIDTGNCLREPLSHKPVAVISKEVADKLKEGDERGIYVIPYKSVGMERGMLEGFMADHMEISKEEKGKVKIIKVVKPILAEYAGKFTENNHYQMLLHPEMVGEGEAYV